MKIQKILLTSLLIAGLSPALHSEEISDIKKFYEDLGYKKGKIRGMEEGYQMALNDFRMLLKQYEEDIAAREAGKYMMKTGKISYPKIYKIRKGDSYSIKIMAPTVENEFTAEDLFIVPLMNNVRSGKIGRGAVRINDSLSYGESSMHSGDNDVVRLGNTSKEPVDENSFDLPDLNTLSTKNVRPNTISAVQKKISLTIPYKSATVESVLHTFGSKFKETSTGYIVNFADLSEKSKFCEELTGDRTCSKL